MTSALNHAPHARASRAPAIAIATAIATAHASFDMSSPSVDVAHGAVERP